MPSSDAVLGDLLEESQLATPDQVPDLLARAARVLGAVDAVAYLADLQQQVLVPFLEPERPAGDEQLTPLGIDSTLAGRCFQRLEELRQRTGAVQVLWLPLLDGTERLGVLSVVVAAGDAEDGEALDSTPFRRLAAASGELVASKAQYGDTIVRLRRRAELGLAAEIQWGLLPPLTFASREVVVAGHLEPAYRVAGDTLDYAVDGDVARAAVFDGMGHGLRSAQLAAVAVAAHRNARRRGLGLEASVAAVDAGLVDAFGGSDFTTGVLVELDTTSGRLEWVSAGHPPPLLLRRHRLVRVLEVVPALPMGFGYVRDARFGPVQRGSEPLEPGDVVVLHTDGVVEARSPGGEQFGMQRFLDLLAEHLDGGMVLPEVLRRVVSALLRHQEGQLTDDASVLLLQWRGDAEALTTLPG